MRPIIHGFYHPTFYILKVNLDIHMKQLNSNSTQYIFNPVNSIDSCLSLLSFTN